MSVTEKEVTAIISVARITPNETVSVDLFFTGTLHELLVCKCILHVNVLIKQLLWFLYICVCVVCGVCVVCCVCV